METRPFGDTGLRVSILGFGAGHVGGEDLTEDEAGRLLNGALDLGVTLFDTARAYGLSEERIGRHLAHRRGEIVLSTKGGYGIEGVADWTGEAVARGIDEALGRLRTGVIDVFHLHSCGTDVLAREDVLRALEDARRAGKIRVAAYSGENEPLDQAVSMSVFGSVQCSVNLADQRVLSGAVWRAGSREIGVIGKRPIANAAWRFAERPRGDYAEVYWERLQSLVTWKASELPDVEWLELALRFSAFATGVSSVIVGTRSLENLKRNAAVIGRGRLESRVFEGLRKWFREKDRDWRGQV